MKKVKIFIVLQLFRQTCHGFCSLQRSTKSTFILHLSSSNKPSKRVVVVGGGVGGLAIASRIAHQIKSCQVTILEKNKGVGGRCGSTFVDVPNLGVFRHERGPSLLLLPVTYEELFTDCGSTAQEHGLTLTQSVPACKAVFSDGDTIDIGFPQRVVQTNAFVRKANEESRQKLDQIEPDGSAKWDEYMRATNAFLDCGLPNFIEERLDLNSLPSFALEALRKNAKFWPLKPHSDVLDAVFTSPKLKALASFQDLYVGLEPYRNNKEKFGGVLRKTAPGVFGLLSALELHPTNPKSGVFAPIGGFQAVTNAFESLALSQGVDIQCNCSVTKVDNEGVHYKQSNGSIEFMPADMIVVNADLPYAEATILNDHLTSEHYDWNDKGDFSSGVVAFHWSLNKRLEKLNAHNVFLAVDSPEQSWSSVRDPLKDRLEIEPCNFYVHRPICCDPSAAPQGSDVLMVLVPCQSLHRNAEFAKLDRGDAIEQYTLQFSQEYISKMRETVLKRLNALPELMGLESHIVDEFIDTPGSFADLYNLAAGVPFGLSHGLSQLSLTRPAAEVAKFDNVLMVGASSRPGNGVPLVLIGSKLVANKVVKKLQI